MKIPENRLSPYPTIRDTFEASDYVDARLTATHEIKYNVDHAEIPAVLTAEINIENGMLAGLVEAGSVTVGCIIDSPYTKTRLEYIIPAENYKHWEKEIPLESLSGPVEVIFVLVAAETFFLMKDAGFREPYAACNKQEFREGTIIGYTSSETDIVEKAFQNDKNAKVSSIMRITSKKGANKIEYNAHQPTIDIFIPEEDYNLYAITLQGKAIRTKQAVYCNPVLISILSDIMAAYSDPDNGVCPYEPYAWFTSLNEKVKDKGYAGMSDPKFLSVSAFVHAQELLDNCMGDSLCEYKKMIDRSLED